MQISVDSSTGLLIKEARKRGIDVFSFPKANPNLFLLELDDHREPIYFTSTDGLGHVTFKIFLNKALTDEFLKHGGFPAPASMSTGDITVIKDFLAKHKRIVIKPKNSVWGQGVTPGITDEADVAPALELAQSFNMKGAKKVVCQEHIDGDEYRLLVVGQKKIFAVHRIPAHVLGDGTSTVEALVAQWNESVQEDRKIAITPHVKTLIKNQGFAVDSVPKKDARVLLKLVANAHAGGTIEDAADLVGAKTKATALAVARYFNVQVVGVDCITEDISKDIGRIIELNSTPDITLHHNPTAGKPRDAAAAIVDVLFPETAESSDVSDST